MDYLFAFLVLFWLHFVADYPLQGEFLAKFKGSYDYLLFCHAVIWAGTISAGLVYLGLFAYWKVAMLLIGHFIIDMWKAQKPDKVNALTKDLWIDQALHMVQIITCLI